MVVYFQNKGLHANLSVSAAITTESTPPENRRATLALPCTTEVAATEQSLMVSWLGVGSCPTLGALTTLEWMACWRTDSKCCARVCQSVSCAVIVATKEEQTQTAFFSLDTESWLPLTGIVPWHSEVWTTGRVGSWRTSTVLPSEKWTVLSAQLSCLVESGPPSTATGGTVLRSHFSVQDGGGSCLLRHGNGTCKCLSLTTLNFRQDCRDDNWSMIPVSPWKQTSVKESKTGDMALQLYHFMHCTLYCRCHMKAAQHDRYSSKVSHLLPSRGSRPAQLQKMQKRLLNLHVRTGNVVSWITTPVWLVLWFVCNLPEAKPPSQHFNW